METPHEYFNLSQISGINNDLEYQNINITPGGIPKIIWSFWNSNQIPDIVRLCIYTWKKSNPDFQIIFLTYDTYEKYIYVSLHPNFRDNHARFTDLLRLSLLSKYGGVWLDSTVIVKKSLNDILSIKKSFFAYHNENYFIKSPHIESWFLAAPPNSSFISAWLNEFLMLEKMKPKDYVKLCKSVGVDFKSLGSYHAVYYSYRKIIEIDSYPIDNLFLINIGTRGPLSCHEKVHWNTQKIVDLLLSNDICSSGDIIKLCSGERKILMKGKYKKIFKKFDLDA